MTQPKNFAKTVTIWTANANQMLKGKVFSHIEYQTIKDRQDMGWNRSAPVIVFTGKMGLKPRGFSPTLYYINSPY